MKILLFGRDGKVGTVLAPALRAAGHEVTGIEAGDPVTAAGHDVAVDFTAPASVLGNATAALSAGRSLRDRDDGPRPTTAWRSSTHSRASAASHASWLRTSRSAPS